MEQTITLGERLKKARELHGPTERVALDIGISTHTLQKVISGVEPKQVRVINAIKIYLATKDL